VVHVGVGGRGKALTRLEKCALIVPLCWSELSGDGTLAHFPSEAPALRHRYASLALLPGDGSLVTLCWEGDGFELFVRRARQGGEFRLPRIADALKRHDADVVVLSEYRNIAGALGTACFVKLCMRSVIGTQRVGLRRVYSRSTWLCARQTDRGSLCFGRLPAKILRQNTFMPTKRLPYPQMNQRVGTTRERTT
jgi:hypothetical protein